MNDKTKLWISKGYEIFALDGENGLAIERLAKIVGISKSSFYHYFADLDIFISILLEHHLAQTHIIAHKERNAQSINPHLINILVEHQIDLLFNRQLRINAHNPQYLDTLTKSTQIIGNDFVKLWLRDTPINMTLHQAESMFSLALDNFFLQINRHNINPQWMSNYFENLKNTASNFI